MDIKKIIASAKCDYFGSLLDKDGFAVHTHTTTETAKSPGNVGVNGRRSFEPRAPKKVIFPWVGELPIALRGFLTLILERAWRFGLKYTDDTDVELARLTGLSRSTVSEYLRALRKRGLIQSAMVGGRRRIYPVDGNGNPTMPAELAVGARPTRKAPAPVHACAHAAPPTIGDPARVVVVQRDRDSSEGAEKSPERQRPLVPAVGCMVEPGPWGNAAPGCLTAPIATAAVAPTTVAALAAHGVASAAAIEETPCVESWSDLVRTSAASAKSPEQQLLDALTAEERTVLDGLSLAKRNTILRESQMKDTESNIAYLRRRLATLGSQGAAVAPAAMSETEMIRETPKRNDPCLAHATAQRLANRFADAKFFKGFDLLMLAVWRRTIDPEAVAFAFEKTAAKMEETRVPRPGAYFWRTLRDRTGIKGKDLEQLAAGG